MVPCRLSILRNANVACLCRLFFTMSHVEFMKGLCHMSLACYPMSHFTRAHVAMSNFKNGHVALSNVGVNIHPVQSFAYLCNSHLGYFYLGVV